MNKQKEYYGKELTLDLHGCDLAIINSKKKLAEYAVKLCEIIKMKRYGKPLIPFFGIKDPKTEGYSLVQLIETSSITGHFSNDWLSAYINIFSCRDFDAEKAAEFTKTFFRAQKIKARLAVRK